MAGREVREYTNLSDSRDKRWYSKGLRDKIDDEDAAFKKMVARMQEVAGERGGYLHGRGALDSDDLLYLKEQMEAEEDAERVRRRSEKKAFDAFKKAASLVDASQAPAFPAIRVEPKPRSGIRQQDLLKSIVEVKPKRVRVAGPATNDRVEARSPSPAAPTTLQPQSTTEAKDGDIGLLGLAYQSSDEDE
ncbi:uncharacterized protein LOC9651192 isoform X2 [Selaginella moellendorffii]|uniref:uncharacterized protein LOC9662076 isoform X2 n=1 Tax=Selaginella moellendorffii TaxID=88036 RepID=UPI000D1C9CDB|nr:uncharacterized protein LOC9662076 isoform X2 [Selaginella moellendorffii]XP_024544669.1 uncharacterized protein LOC9651192 isoform X2 [Selaginella moellendorffii]|eukprot:XP_024543753.1 uncharacterized protein LOC9662076 isoform X2 [Selaginella moellendorffii]